MSELNIATIHQPNFFPWLGYFNKIIRADTFVVLDEVQFAKTGGTWSNRVKLLLGGKPNWVTMPIQRSYHGVLPYHQILIDDNSPWRTKFIQSLKMNYARSPFYQTMMDFLQPLILYPADGLVDFNLHAIRSILQELGFEDTKFVMQSSLGVVGNATDLLIALAQAVDGDAYLCGEGAYFYQEDEKFAEAGIEVIYQNYQHPQYAQTGVQHFIPGLSIIDALMNCSFSGVRELLLYNQRD